MKKRRLGKVLAMGAGLLAALDYGIYPRLEVGAPQLTTRNNAVWLDFAWARGTASETVPHLAARLRENGFNSAYFHVRYIGKSGRLRFRDAPSARRLNAEMEKQAPALRRVAWLYIGNERGITGVDISNREIRRRIVDETRFLTQNCGFDGLQIDYEICSDGDGDFLQLLLEIRVATPKT